VIGPDGDVFLYIKLAPFHVFVAENEEELHRFGPAMDAYFEDKIEEDVEDVDGSGTLGERIECVLLRYKGTNYGKKYEFQLTGSSHYLLRLTAMEYELAKSITSAL